MSARRIRLSFRPPQKTQQFNINSSNSSSEHNSDENIGLNNWSAPPMPKHVPFPFVPYNSDLTNEIWIFIFTFLSASTQFIQLYRTMFFLSGTHLNNKSVNFHLIDKYLIFFIMTMISRRFIYCCLCMVIQTLLPRKYEQIVKQFLKFIFCTILLVILIGCSIKICQKYNYFYLFCLSYPIILYLFIFRLNIEPFLKTHAENDVYICGMPLHSCSANAMQVREEIDMLKTDFNNRFKQVIFTSMLNAYFACFIPCCFVHKATYYDSFRSTQHLFFVWVSGFCQLVAQSFPLKYSDILHRSSQHLGQWNKIGHRSSHPPPLQWTKNNTIWSMGSYVKYLGEIYRSTGCTSAIPGNTSHHRFYTIFKNPSVLYLCLAAIVLAIVVIQLFILSISIAWHNTIAICFLLLSNFMTLFTLIRDYLVAKYVYYY